MLIPEYMSDHGRFDDYPIVASLKEHALFHVVRPEESVGKKETERLAEMLIDIIAAGGLDHLTQSRSAARRTNFGSLSMSRLGYLGNKDLADFIFQELKARGLADSSKDGVSIPMHRTVRALILVLLAQILRSKGADMGLTLSPATDQERLVEALKELVSNPDSSTPSVGDIVSFDMDMVGVDLASVPMDEVLDFRKQNYPQHRAYRLSVRRFARELSLMPAEERAAAFEQRQEELKDAAHAIESASVNAWKKPISFGLKLAGAAWTLHTGDPIGAALAGAGSILEDQSTKTDEIGVYSYLFTARQSLL